MQDLDLKEVFLDFYFDELGTQGFLQFIERNILLLEKHNIPYLELLDSTPSLRSLKDFVSTHFNKVASGDLKLERAYQLMQKILDGKGGDMLLDHFHEIAAIQAEYPNVIPIEFVGICSEMEEIPLLTQKPNWDPQAFDLKRKEIESFKPAIHELCKQTLASWK